MKAHVWIERESSTGGYLVCFRIDAAEYNLPPTEHIHNAYVWREKIVSMLTDFYGRENISVRIGVDE